MSCTILLLGDHYSGRFPADSHVTEDQNYSGHFGHIGLHQLINCLKATTMVIQEYPTHCNVSLCQCYYVRMRQCLSIAAWTTSLQTHVLNTQHNVCTHTHSSIHRPSKQHVWVAATHSIRTVQGVLTQPVASWPPFVCLPSIPQAQTSLVAESSWVCQQRRVLNNAYTIELLTVSL